MHVTSLIIKWVVHLPELSAHTNSYSPISGGHFMIVSFIFVILFLLLWYSRKWWKQLCTELCHVIHAVCAVITAPIILFVGHLSNFTLISSNVQDHYFFLEGGGKKRPFSKISKNSHKQIKV